jgi:hypothetical protein
MLPMREWPPFVPYLILAFICGLASVGILFIAMAALARGGLTDNGMLAVAGMVGAPAVMGIGIAAYMQIDRR